MCSKHLRRAQIVRGLAPVFRDKVEYRNGQGQPGVEDSYASFPRIRKSCGETKLPFGSGKTLAQTREGGDGMVCDLD